MDLPCKVCQQSFPIGKSDTHSGYGSEWCPHCKHYYAMLNTDETQVWFEHVIVKNYTLVFLSTLQHATVLETEGLGQHKIIYSFPLTELTHDLAVEWVNKLKLYVVFQ